MKKEYPIPEELLELYDEYSAAMHARQDAVSHSYFKFQLRNAVYYGRIAEKKRREFWNKVRELYPEIAEKHLYLDTIKLTVSVVQEK